MASWRSGKKCLHRKPLLRRHPRPRKTCLRVNKTFPNVFWNDVAFLPLTRLSLSNKAKNTHVFLNPRCFISIVILFAVGLSMNDRNVLFLFYSCITNKNRDSLAFISEEFLNESSGLFGLDLVSQPAEAINQTFTGDCAGSLDVPISSCPHLVEVQPLGDFGRTGSTG